MAKLSAINKNNRRIKLSNRYYNKRMVRKLRRIDVTICKITRSWE